MDTTLTRPVFDRFRELVYTETGISLGPSKEALVAARVGKRLRALGLPSFDAYLEHLAADEAGGELTQLVDAICTNVTSFFREEDHFELVRETVKRWHDEGTTRFRLWSAACSTGEEPYSLAMSLFDVASADEVDLRILGTDLSCKALLAGMEGVYDRKRTSVVDPLLLDRFFECVPDQKGGHAHRVTDELRSLVTFRHLNLSEPPFAMNGPLDIVMCRNVMIYFDAEVRERLLREIHRLLKRGGLLIVGHSESLSGMRLGFEPVRASVYVRL